jgi:hypothetical protein
LEAKEGQIMRLVLKGKQLTEREVAGSSLADQAHVSPYDVEKTVDNIMNMPRLATFNRRHTKPFGLYTSSTVKVGKMLRSDWYGFMNSEQFGHAESIVVLKVNPSAKIQEVNSGAEYMELFRKYGKNPLGLDTYGLNFDEIAKEFDGFRITRDGYYDVRDISYGWDVEQTVWFNNRALTLLPVKPDAEIRAPKGSPQFIKEKYDFMSQFEPGYPD